MRFKKSSLIQRYFTLNQNQLNQKFKNLLFRYLTILKHQKRHLTRDRNW